MSRVYLKNKTTGVTYVYECVSFWDKIKKKPASKCTCIGKLDPGTGELIPSKRFQSSIEDTARSNSYRKKRWSHPAFGRHLPQIANS